MVKYYKLHNSGLQIGFDSDKGRVHVSPEQLVYREMISDQATTPWSAVTAVIQLKSSILDYLRCLGYSYTDDIWRKIMKFARDHDKSA